jgi:hypothetical protein
MTNMQPNGKLVHLISLNSLFAIEMAFFLFLY